MTVTRQGDGTYRLDGAYLAETYSVVGPLEGKGPLAEYFHRVWRDEGKRFPSFERAERALLGEAQDGAVSAMGIGWDGVDLVLGGDLLDQLISTNFAGRDHRRPLFGLFSACATFSEGMGLAGLLVASGGPRRVVVAAVSHHLAAERQFRFPLELGYQRAPTASWTATAAGAAIVTHEPGPLRLEAATVGRVVDWGQSDPNDMATAMAPAAVDTIRRHLEALGERPTDYDAIVTGDLGALGVELARHLAAEEYDLDLSRLDDCGLLLYDRKAQDVHNGASGTGCSAAVFSSYLVHQLRRGTWRRVLLVATGALFSPTSNGQGETVPTIAHAVAVGRGGTA